MLSTASDAMVTLACPYGHEMKEIRVKTLWENYGIRLHRQTNCVARDTQEMRNDYNRQREHYEQEGTERIITYEEYLRLNGPEMPSSAVYQLTAPQMSLYRSCKTCKKE